MTRKLLIHDAAGTREVLMVGRMTIGRDPRCEISDPDPLLSRHHAEFTTEPDGIRVRDLHSRNGLQVNGSNMNEAVLRSGDVVRIARLTIRYAEDRGVPAGGADPANAGDDPDNTIVVPAPIAAAAATGPQVAQENEDDATRVLPPPGAAGAGTRPDQPPAARRRMVPVPGAIPAPPAAAAATRRSPWSTRVTVRLLVLSIAVFTAAAVPLLLWQQRVIDRVGIARAAALGQWLAAAAAAAHDAGAAAASVDALSGEASVVAAVVLRLDGRVVSPASRATETIPRIPGMDAAVSDVLRPRAAWHGEFVEIAVPVVSRRDGRVAVAWLTVRPAAVPEAGAGALVVLAPALLLAVGGAFLVAWQVRRITLRGLRDLNQNIELALSGHLAAVVDPLHARPLRELTDTLNYLIARVRVAGAAPPDRTPAHPAPGPAPEPAGAAAVARVVADASFLVSEATPGCADVLGMKPEALLGRHLLDAMGDDALGDAVLRCLAGLPDHGRGNATIPARGLALSIARSRADAPVVLTFTRIPTAVQV